MSICLHASQDMLNNSDQGLMQEMILILLLHLGRGRGGHLGRGLLLLMLLLLMLLITIEGPLYDAADALRGRGPSMMRFNNPRSRTV